MKYSCSKLIVFLAIATTLLRHNIFLDIVQEVVLAGHPTIQSHFSDTEAANICSKMTSGFARNLSNKFNSLLDKSKLDVKFKYQMHFLVEKALKNYGGYILTFLYKLRQLKFANKSAYQLVDFRQEYTDFPALSFKRAHDTFTMSFAIFAFDQDKPSSFNVNIYSKNAKKCIGIINNEGHFIKTLQSTSIKFSLFYDEISQLKPLEFYSGVETGHCMKCGRPLSDSISLRYGIGPICRQEMDF